MPNEILNEFLPPLPHPQPRSREVQFRLGAVLQHSGTPSLRVAGFEDENDDEDENEAPCEHPQPATRVQFSAGAIPNPPPPQTPLIEDEDDYEAPGESGAYATAARELIPVARLSISPPLQPTL